jgi:hypothetical protein
VLGGTALGRCTPHGRHIAILEQAKISAAQPHERLHLPRRAHKLYLERVRPMDVNDGT